MKSFSMKDGDVVVDKTIQMCDGAELLRQKVERVLGTYQGEWEFDTEEGINDKVVLKKSYNEDEIRGTIEAALRRVDETFVLLAFSLSVNERRHATITIKAVNADGVEIGGDYLWQ